jgi:translocation and assembly module TamA
MVFVALLACGNAAVLAGEAAGPRYTVQVNAPAPIKDIVERNLDLVRWQDYAELTPEFLDLLVANAKDQARSAAETVGYFSSTVTSSIDDSTKPPTIRINIEPGEPTLVTSVKLEVTGPAADSDAAASAQIAKMRSTWLLPQGEIFRQTQWSSAKAAALLAIAADRFAAAKIVSSEASIDPVTHAAALSLTIDSGPAFRFGALEVSGLEKYPETVLRNLVTFSPGQAYTLDALNDYVRRVNGTGYFASVQANIDADPQHADAAPVMIAVIEAPTKRFSAGIGFSTDTLYSGQVGYDTFNIDGNGMQLRTDLRLDAKLQNATVRLTLPPRDPQYTDNFVAKLEQTDISDLSTNDIVAGWTRQTADPRSQSVYSTNFYYSRRTPNEADTDTSHAVYFEYGHTWRRVDDPLAPTRGYVLAAQVGGAPPGVSTLGFVRGVAQVAGWIPIDDKTQIALKAEVGAVAARSANGVPTPLLFRTGGDTTVRGYAFQSLGPRLGTATIPGRYYALASAEIVRWIGSFWGLATFVDAGNAADRFGDLKPVYGYGVGGRIKTPIGPFRIDFAYGEATKSVRVHLSVGLSF